MGTGLNTVIILNHKIKTSRTEKFRKPEELDAFVLELVRNAGRADLTTKTIPTTGHPDGYDIHVYSSSSATEIETYQVRP